MTRRLQLGLGSRTVNALCCAVLCGVALCNFAAPCAAQTTPATTPQPNQNPTPQTPQSLPKPGVPASSKPGDQIQTPASAQQQPETPATKPIPLEQSTPGKVAVPKAVPSMMPQESGQMLDRIVAIVNGEVVLDSDVDEEHRFEAIQPYPNTIGQPTREREIERLINRDLISQQAKLQSDINITDDQVEKEIAGLRKTLPACKQFDCATDAGWAKFLSSKGFTPEEFRIRWKERMQVLAFIQERFGAGAVVSGAQIREFYNNTMLPQYKKAGVKPAPLASVEGRIREVLEQQEVSNLLRDWLQSLRAQGSITVLHPGEEAP